MLKVLFVASELTPLAKVGGLGDVVGSLPKALAKLGIDARIIIPRYEAIDKVKWGLRRAFAYNNHDNDDDNFVVYETKLPGSKVKVYLIENNKYLSKGPIYFQKTAFVGGKKEIDRFVFFSKAVYQLLTRTYTDQSGPRGQNNIPRSPFKSAKSALGWQPDIVHCNDWHTGELVRLLRHSEAKPKNLKRSFAGAQDDLVRVIYTIHNLANQGNFNGTNLMAEGIKNADLVTTVSETYAKEITTKKFGAGLEKLLKKRAAEGKLKGILNGIDYGFWPLVKRNKSAFQKKLGLKQGNHPIFGLVARLTPQKGIKFITPLIDKFVKKFEAQFVFLGTGKDEFEEELKQFAKKYPKMVYTKTAFDEDLAHDIYAQSDFFLMPSRFEPSGLGQMIAMRYGTLPIVRATGGLKDSVKGLQTGFVFKAETSVALAGAMRQSVDYYYNKPAKLKKMIQSAKKQDFSWKKSALKYKKLYKSL